MREFKVAAVDVFPNCQKKIMVHPHTKHPVTPADSVNYVLHPCHVGAPYKDNQNTREANSVHQRLSISFTRLKIRETYAAVAANISIRLALVATAKVAENMTVNKQTSPSLACIRVTNDRLITATKGASEDTTVPMASTTVSTCWSE
jgi:hypothetical protein